MSDVFANDKIGDQHQELVAAFPYWTTGAYPQARNIGDVVLLRRQVALRAEIEIDTTTQVVTLPETIVNVIEANLAGDPDAVRRREAAASSIAERRAQDDSF